MNKALGLLELARYHATARTVDPGTQPARFTYLQSGARDESESSEPLTTHRGEVDEQPQR